MFKKFGKLIIFLIILITGLNVYFILTLNFNYDFESFFSTEDQDLRFYNEHRERFENDNDFLLVGLRDPKGVFRSEFMQAVDSAANEISRLPHITDVRSPTNISNLVIFQDPVMRMELPTPIPFIHLDEPDRIKSDSSYIFKFKELIGTFFSEDGKSVALFVKTTNKLPKTQADTLNKSLDSLLAAFPFPEVHVAGKSKAETVYVEKMQNELIVFISISQCLIIIFLFVAFRSTWGVILPLIVVLLAVIWSLGAMGIGGKPIDVMTVLLPTIIFVVGMSDVVHIVTKYLEELRLGTEKQAAITKTIKEVGLATFLTSFTTAIGFLTLISTGIRPIQDFGLYSAIAVFLAFILAFTFLPSILAHLPVPKIASQQVTQLFWYRNLHRFLRWILRNKKSVLVGAAVVSGLSIWGITYITVDSHLIDEVSDRDPLKQDFLFFEREFSGVRPFEMAVEVQDSTLEVFDREVLQQLEKIDTYLETTYGADNIVSPVSIFKTLQRSYSGGDPQAFALPGTEREHRQLKRKLDRVLALPKFSVVIDSTGRRARISGKMVDIGSKKAEVANAKLMSFVKSETDSSIVKLTLTGSANLIDKNNISLSKNMMIGLAIAFGVIALIMGLLYRSLKIIVIAFIPNVIPLLIIGGVIGFWDIGLKMSTSIIFTIAFGIAVDDTIHFMSKLKLELAKEKSLMYAIKRTFISTGKAIIVTSIILVGGFLTLVYSDFNGTFYTGLFISLTLFFAVLADLMLIPVLLIYLFKPKVRAHGRK